ncbi:hypothetical protein [Streptomyces roseifaciens]|uniref:hypothetical protein n=1 Tax=Streptomyces roseifaciens TaxID=1488406 RepID=UPI0007182AFF|nr:hypothetical protein [Streptomyces roseifaciens]
MFRVSGGAGWRCLFGFLADPALGLGRRRQTAASSKQHSGWLVVTHSFHPLSGRRVEVLYSMKRGSMRMFVVDTGSGARMTVPVERTDRGPAAEGARLSAEYLTELRAVVDVLANVAALARVVNPRVEVSTLVGALGCEAAEQTRTCTVRTRSRRWRTWSRHGSGREVPGVNGEGKITASHRARLAIVYLRQSTMLQVRDHTESTTPSRPRGSTRWRSWR